jgi:PAS domain S-box-containing protein
MSRPAAPDAARRRRLLNVLLAGLAALSLLTLLGSSIVDLSTPEQFGELYATAVAVLIDVVAIWTINRYGPAWLASATFLLMLTVVLIVSDTPAEIAAGRSTFVFVIPILMASFLLQPWASFAMAGLCSLLLSAIALSLPALPNVPSMAGLFAVALVSWLAARSLQQALRDLRASKARYRAIVEDQSELICRFRPDGAMTFANRAFCRYFDVPSGETLIGRSVQALVAEVSAGDPRYEAFLATLRALEPAQTIECPMLVRGEKRWLQWTARQVCTGQGQVIEYQCVGRDVTPQVSAEEQLAESEERFRRMAERIQDGLTIVERGRVVYVNDRMCEIAGRSRAELATISGIDLAAPEEKERLRQAMETARRTGTLPNSLSFWIVRPDGSRRCIHNRYTVTQEPQREAAPHAGSGPIDRYVVTTDVTEQRRIEAHLRQAQKMEAMGRLAAGVAHDFNNYLTVIDSYTDLLRMNLAPDAPMRHELAEIARAVEQSKSLVRQLLAFSRLQTHTAGPQVQDLDAAIAGAAHLLPHLAGRHISLDISRGPDLGQVHAAPGQIAQMLLNLVANARDAISGTGTISIRAERVDADTVLLSVRDTGAGIAPHILPHIFEPFYTTKADGEGTGLGLSIVHGIVRQSGGRVEVESEPGHGTVFRIYLPTTDAQGARNDPPDPDRG